MKSIKLPLLCLSISIVLFAACGKKDGGSKAQPMEAAIQEQISEGTYRAVLRPINNSLSGYLPTGAAEISILGDDVQMKTYLDDDARVAHMQQIYTGTRCPEVSDDKNNDGLVDINEALGVVGNPLIPLDGDINSKDEGAGVFPRGASFTYLISASLAKLESDVRNRTGQNLNLGGRVILIHGANSGAVLPETVTTIDGMEKSASIPIVCGIIERLETAN